jgi:hypothetical protein
VPEHLDRRVAAGPAGESCLDLRSGTVHVSVTTT